MSAERPNQLRLAIGNDPSALRLLAGYVSQVEVVDRAGNRGVGVTNLKRMFGHPDELRTLVTALAEFVADADAVAAADSGAAPLTAALAFHLGKPAVFVRSTPKTHFLSYGGDPQYNHPLLAGEHLPSGCVVVIIDDLLHTGETIVSAAKTLGEVDVAVSSASCLLAAPPGGWHDRLQQAGFESVTALALTTELGFGVVAPRGGRAVAVRPARPGDEHEIAEVHVRSWQAAYRGQVPDEFLEGLSVARRTAVWRRIIDDSEPPASQVFVLEESERVVGFAHVAPSRDDDACEDVGELTAIYVLPDSWRAGGGRMLMTRALASLRSASVSEATLWVLETNERARRFYEALGWVPDGATKDEQRDGFTLHEVRYRRAVPAPVQSPG